MTMTMERPRQLDLEAAERAEFLAQRRREREQRLEFEALPPLDRWLLQKHDPAWRLKPRRVTKPRPFRLGRSEFARLAKQFELVGVGIDMRTDAMKARTVEEFMELKHDTAWKYKPYVAPKSALKRLSDKEFKAEENRIRQYVTSRKASS